MCAVSGMDGCITIALHHGGVFVNDPVADYVGGKIEFTPNMDIDFLSIPHIEKNVGSLGYMNIKNLWYRLPRTEFSEGIRLLESDKDLLEMVSSLGPMDMVLHIYVEHGIDEPSQVINPPLLIGFQSLEGEYVIGSDDDGRDNEEEATDTNADIGNVNLGADNEAQENEGGLDGADEQAQENEGGLDGADEQPQENEGGLDDVSLGGGSDDDCYQGDDESGGESVKDDENLFSVDVNCDENVDEDEEWESSEGDGSSDDEVVGNVSFEQPPHSDYENSSKAPSPASSEDEVSAKKPKFPKYEEPEDLHDIKLEVGQRYRDSHDAKEAVRNYAIAGGYRIRFLRNAKDRVTARCAKGCDWYFHSSWMQQQQTFQCKVLKEEHSCATTAKNPLITSSWLAKRYLEKWRENPEWSISTFRNHVGDDFGSRISRS